MSLRKEEYVERLVDKKIDKYLTLFVQFIYMVLNGVGKLGLH